MKISFACTGCGKTLSAPQTMARKQARCPHCKTVVAIPGGSSQGPSATPRSEPASGQSPSSAAARPPQRRSEEPAGYRLQEDADPPPPQPEPRRPPATVSPSGTVPSAARSPRSSPRPGPGVGATPSGGGWSPPGNLYWLFALALVPLAGSLLMGESDDVEQRFLRTLEAAPQINERLEELTRQGEDLDRKDLLKLFPDGRIEGAHLAAETWTHWFYAVLSAAAFFGLVLVIFPRGHATPWQLIGVALATATAGVLSLILFQWIAAVTQGVVLFGSNFIVLALFYIVKFIGFSYSAAADPETNFWLSFLGFTCGVGFCEELTKAMPVVFHYRGSGDLGWRGACMWGLASGIGFGVAEGIIYSADYYNGIATGDIYVVRFVSCVALHAVWSAAAAVSIYNNQDLFASDWEWSDFLVCSIKVLGVPMVLHGLYDTLLKREMNGLALLTAVASFFWMVLLIELARRQEPGSRRHVGIE